MLVPLAAYNTPVMCSGCQGFPQVRPSYPFVNNAPSFTNYPGYARPDQFYHPQPRPVRPPPPPPSAYGNKRAVLFGISYGKQVNRIKGSVNDAHCMKYFLIDKLGFPSDSIRMLTGSTSCYIMSLLFVISFNPNPKLEKYTLDMLNVSYLRQLLILL